MTLTNLKAALKDAKKSLSSPSTNQREAKRSVLKLKRAIRAKRSVCNG